MARPPRADVTQGELDALFEFLDIWSKTGDGRLTVEPIIKKRQPSRDYPGGVSDILRLRNVFGYQVATSHRITDVKGSVPHQHGKDLLIGDVLLRPV